MLSREMFTFPDGGEFNGACFFGRGLTVFNQSIQSHEKLTCLVGVMVHHWQLNCFFFCCCCFFLTRKKEKGKELGGGLMFPSFLA